MKPTIYFRAMTPDDHEQFVRETSYYPGPQFGGIVAWSGERANVMGAVGLDSWTPRSVMVHWFIKQPRCLMPLWNELVAYVSRHGKRKLIGSTPSNNVRALRMIFGRLGWQEVARIKDGWDEGVDIVVSEYQIPALALRFAA